MMTFMFTDIEGSSRLWAADRELMSGLLEIHDSILSRIISGNGGRIVKHTGDGVFAVFDDTADACTAALGIQLAAAADESLGGRMRLRIGIHCGDAVERDGDLFGPDVNMAARVMAAALGGQVLLTSGAAAGPPPGATFRCLGSHSLKDMREPVELWSLSHPGLADRYSRTPKRLTVPHSLPAEQSPFVGREAEMTKITSLLSRPDCRLLTLLGQGGAGKTRLAVRTAIETGHRFRDGVFFVPLAEITEVDGILPGIAAAMSFDPPPGESLDEALRRYLGDREVLLVLDNFEQLAHGAPLLASLLEAAGDLRIVVSSRERLRLQAEWVFRVPGMEVPPDGGTAEESDAVRLFLETARRSGSAPPGEDDYGTVSRICRVLEGSPLAIELAASWCGLLTVGEIELQVADPGSLESPDRDRPDRHGSLEAVFRFSWNLLEEDLRRVLCSLTVFRGGFDREAARTVCGAGLRELGALRDRSLIWQLEEGYFGIHGTVRHFASLLAEDVLDDTEARLDSYAEYFTGLMAGVEQELVRGDRPRAVRLLERDLDNIRSAWGISVSTGRTDLMETALKGLCTILGIKGQFREIERMLTTAVASVEERGGCELLGAHLLTQLGWASSHIRSLEECEPHLRRSIELYRKVGSPEDLAHGLNGYANLLNVNDEHGRAALLYRESLELFRRIGDRDGTSAALNNLGILAERRGDLGEAEALYLESADISRRTGNLHGVSVAVTNLATVVREQGDVERSRALLDEGLEIERSAGDGFNVAIIEVYRTELLVIGGDYAGAGALAESALKCFEAQGHLWWVVRTRLLLALIRLEQGDPGSGAEMLSKALEVYEVRMRQVHVAELLAVAALYLSGEGRTADACVLASIALDAGVLAGYMTARLDGVMGGARSVLTTDGFRECLDRASSMDAEAAVCMVREALTA